MASPYEVAIHLTVTGNAQAGLAGLGKQVDELNKGVKDLHKAFALIFVGGEMKRWGEEALGFVKKMLDAAGNFQHVQSQMSAMGLTQKEIAGSVANSWKLAGANIHVSVQEMAEMNRHAIEIFGSASAAAEHMSLMGRLAEFQARWGAGKTGLKQVDVPMAIRDMMKTSEGAAMLSEDPKKFDKFAENLMRAIIAAGGNVSATQYLQGQRHARAAAFSWEDSFRFGVFPAMVQEYGPNAGVQMFQAFKKLTAGVEVSKTSIIQGIEMGLIDPKKVEYDKVGRPLRLLPGAMIHGNEFASDPLKFTEQYITPWLDKHTHGIAERTGALVRLMGRATGSSALIAMDTQAYKYEKDRRLWGNARMEMPDDYEQAMKAFEEKWKDFMVALGTPSLKLATEALGGMTKAILELTGAVLAHPDAARNLLAITAGVGAMITVLGTLAVGVGILGLLGGGAIVVGIAALTGGLAGLAAANWPLVKSKFQEFLDSLQKTDWNKEITEALKPVIAAVKTFFSNLASSIVDSFKGMWEDMKRALHLISYTGGGGLGGGGGGLTNASWSGGGGGVGTGSGADVKAVIDQAADRYGVNRGVMYGIIAGESAHGNRYDSNTRGESSWSMFQLNRAGGLGNKFERDTGLSVTNPANIPAIADWTAKHIARTHDLSPWRGYHGPRNWSPSWGGMGYSPHRKGGGETHVHNNIYLDGKMIAKSTSKHLVRAAQYATSVGRADGRGVFMGPGFEQFS